MVELRPTFRWKAPTARLPASFEKEAGQHSGTWMWILRGNATGSLVGDGIIPSSILSLVFLSVASLASLSSASIVSTVAAFSVPESCFSFLLNGLSP
jgi:hypothetical protein